MKQYRSLFRNRNFILLWAGGAISNIGDFFNGLALVKILSADPAHFGLWMALVMTAKVVPGILLSPVAGVVADRLPRKTVMVVSDVLRAGLVLGLVFTANPAALIALVFLAAAVSAFFNPASGALLPNIVAPDELISAGSLSVMTQRMAMLLGSGIGAAMLMAVGPHNVFYIDAASFIVSALMTGLLKVPAVAAKAGSNAVPGLWAKFAGDVSEALAFLREAPVVRRIMITFGIVAIADAALSVLMATFFIQDLGLAPEKLGFVWAVFAAASVVGALVTGALGSRVHWKHLISYGAVYIWATMVGALVVHRVGLVLVFWALLGLGSGAINAGVMAAMGMLVPDQVRGRVFGGWNMMQNFIYLAGVLSAGALSDTFGPTSVLLGYVTAFLVAGVYALIVFRSVGTGPSERILPGAAGEA